MKKLAFAAAMIAVGACASTALAQETLNGFDSKGTFTINAQGGVRLTNKTGSSVDAGLTPFIGWTVVHSDSEPSTDAGNYQTTKTNFFYINPGADYFIIDHLSIGGEVLFGLSGGSVTTHTHVAGGIQDTTVDSQSGTSFGFFPRVGYNIWITSKISLWPRGGIGVRTTSQSGGGQPDQSDTLWYFAADVPFLFHLVPNFYFGAGPGFTVSLSHRQTVNQGNVSVSGDGPSVFEFRILSAVIGGYF